MIFTKLCSQLSSPGKCHQTKALKRAALRPPHTFHEVKMAFPKYERQSTNRSHRAALGADGTSGSRRTAAF
jgi:hypothetical protein